MARAGVHVFAITALKRTGAGALAADQERFEWDPGTHTSPRADIEFPLSVRTVRDEHAGTNRPVEQVLSVAWQPFHIEGEWRDAWAGAGFAMTTTRAFTDMVARAPLVRVELDEWNIVGLITDFVPRYLDSQRVAWRIAFSPHYHEQDQVSAAVIPPAVTSVATHVQVLAETTAQARIIHEQAATLPFATDAHECATASLDNLAAEIDEFSAAVTGPVSTGVGQARAQLSQFRRVQGAAQRTIETAATLRADVEMAVADAVNLLTADEWARELGRYARLVLLRADEGATSSQALAEATATRRYRPYAGESVYAVAQRFYGTADDWRRIADANQLAALRFSGTEELVIPEVVA